MVLIGVGLLQGTVILVAQAHGARDSATCGAYWRVSFVHGAVLGVVMALLCLLGRWTLEATGQEPEVVIGGGRVLEMIAWGAPALMMWVVCTHFLEGLSRPIPGMLVMFAAVLLNALLNWIFIFGNWGGPEMGAEGAAIATSLVRWVMFGALLVVVFAPARCSRARHAPARLGFLGDLEATQADRLSAGRRTGSRDVGLRGPGDAGRPSRHDLAGRLPDRLQPDRTRLHGRDRDRSGEHDPGRQCGGPPQLDRYHARRMGGCPAHRLPHGLLCGAVARPRHAACNPLHRRPGRSAVSRLTYRNFAVSFWCSTGCRRS